jgi:hypothetical protein
MPVQVVRADEDDGAGRHRQASDGGGGRRLPLDGRSRRIQMERFIEHRAYAESYAKRYASRFFNRPEVRAALEAGWEAIRKDSVYTATKAMQECEEAMAFAKATKNAMALIRAIEIRAKLSGLLHDVLRIEHVDVRAAIAEANARRTLPWTSFKQIAPTVNPFD